MSLIAVLLLRFPSKVLDIIQRRFSDQVEHSPTISRSASEVDSLLLVALRTHPDQHETTPSRHPGVPAVSPDARVYRWRKEDEEISSKLDAIAPGHGVDIAEETRRQISPTVRSLGNEEGRAVSLGEPLERRIVVGIVADGGEKHHVNRRKVFEADAWLTYSRD